MKKKLKIFVFIFYLLIQNVLTVAIKDNRFVKNQSVIDLFKNEIESSENKLTFFYQYKETIFIVNPDKINEIIISVPVFEATSNHKFIRKVNALITIEEPISYDEIFKFMNSENSSLNFKYKISNLEFLLPDNYKSYVSLLLIKYYFRLGNCIDPKKLEKDGRVYYTVPSEDRLDDIHMVYESVNEKKEFKFTNLPERPIVPVEEVEKLGKKPEIKPKRTIFENITNHIFSLFNNNCEKKIKYGHDEECEKLKND